jgi:hypothetical protein
MPAMKDIGGIGQEQRPSKRIEMITDNVKTPEPDTRSLFWNITWRATAGIMGAAWLAQMIFMVLFASFGIAAGVANSPSGLTSPADLFRMLLASMFLALVGGVAGGFFSLPTGFLLGLSGGILASLLTRLFFFPLANPVRYRKVIGIAMAAWGLLGSWLWFMALYLLTARDNRLQSPLAPWLALAAALVVGVCAWLVSRWIVRWYIMVAGKMISGAGIKNPD